MTRRRHVRCNTRQRTRGQALVELALVVPLLFGMVAVLFQFGVIFIVYLSLVHETRDIGRFAAVHPDTIDGTSCTTTDSTSGVSSLWKQACDSAPAVIDQTKLQPTFTPACSATHAPCPARTTSSQLDLTITYDASSSIFLPTNLRMGPWLQFDVTSSLTQLSYDYHVMVEPH